jgi:hypothetical protein
VTPADQFASVSAFGLQVSGGINGYPTSIFVNAPFRGSPNATWGASAKFHVTEEIYAEAGVYQASERLGKLSNHGLDFTVRSNDGELVMAQVGWSPPSASRRREPFSIKMEINHSLTATWGFLVITHWAATTRTLSFLSCTDPTFSTMLARHEFLRKRGLLLKLTSI